MRFRKQYYMTICYPLSASNWMQNECTLTVCMSSRLLCTY